jgi:hypothetical protein
VYSVEEVIRGLRNPQTIGMEIDRLFSRYVYRLIHRPVNFLQRDWDNLLLLDACRSDVMAQHNFPEAERGSVWSGGSSSDQFLDFHLRDAILDDVVWVTANPKVSRHRDRIFEVVDVWETHWNEELGTVLPEDMTQRAIEAEQRYPHKRIVAHYMQPHYPFIGDFGREQLPEYGTFTGGGKIQVEDTDKDIWNLLRDGEADIPMEALWRAYEENLEVVLPQAKTLIERLEGKTVLSSDHGNEFGGRGFPIPVKIYGHPENLRSTNLSKVP